MQKALTIKELAPKIGLGQRGAAYRISRNYKGGAQKVFLPFTPRIKKQKTLISRYVEDFIYSPDQKGNLEPMNPCTLIPCDKGGDILLKYYNREYRYKIPKGAKLLKRSTHGG